MKQAASAAPPSEFIEPCTGPAALPDGAMDAEQVANTMADDRAALLACKARHAGLLGWVDDFRKAIGQ